MEFFFSNIIDNDIITLDNVESRHCIKVMRHKMGDTINVVDGLGNMYIGDLVFIDKKSCKIKIDQINKNYNKRNHYLHIAISPIKNHDRLEWFVEKSVEIGVDEITLINCSRSLRRTVKMERLNKTAVTAMKQALKAYVPIINDIVDLEDFIVQSKHPNSFVCHLENNNRRNLFFYKNSILNKQNSCFLIGPEGDFTLNEIDLCKNYGFNPISLGESRLRTETAGIVACHLTNIIHHCKNE